MNFNKFFVKNYQFTLVIFVAVLILGLNSLLNMPRSEDPPFGAPMFSIIAIYPGTSPQDMEDLIADPIEQEIYQLEDIKRINTTIKDGVVSMIVEFNYGVNVESKNNDIVREIDKLRSSLPEGIIELSVRKASSSDVAILQTAVVSESASFEELKEYAEILEENIERIKEIKFVETQGIPERNVKVDLDIDRMETLNLGLDQVLGLIQANNINIPGGDIDLGARNFNIKTKGEFDSIDDIANTVVNATTDGKITLLSDIANIYYQDESDSHIVRYNGKRAVWVMTAMKDKKNIIQTRKKVEDVLNNIKSDLPDHIQIVQAFDQEKGVRNRLFGLGKDFLIAIFLVLLTLLPLGSRASLIVMISIPLSLSIGLFLLDLFGYTLNQLSIVGMVIALGLLVDDSIVVVENIERYMRKGISAKEAAVSATNHIMVAILGCTATLILAFLPLANLPEGAGEFIRSMPLAVMLTVLASLFVSVTIIPFLSSIILKPHVDVNGTGESGNFFFRAFKKYINNPYQRLLEWCIRRPVITLLIAAIIFGSSLMIVPKIGFSLFPASEKPILVVSVVTEPGSNIHHTDLIARDVEKIIARHPEVKRIATNVGRGNPRIYYNEFQRQNSKSLSEIVLFMDDDMEVPEIVSLSDKLRSDLNGFPGAKIEVKRFQQGTPISAPIEMRLLGNNLDTLERISKEVEEVFLATEGTRYVKNDLRYKKSELNINVDRKKAGLFGLNMAEISKTIRLAIAGLEISEIKNEGKDPNKIIVSTGEYDDNMLEKFDHIFITSPSGSLVPLNNVATISMAPSAPLIYRYNKVRFALVSSFLEEGFNVDKKTDEIIAKINDEVNLPKGYSLMPAGERESREESFGGLGTIIVLTVFGLLAILILEFKTLKSTLIVLSVIPMGIIGALVALMITGETLSFVASIGMIALAGIEIKNSILMVDYTNALRAEGMGLHEAVMDGAETRFLPILLTTLTAIGGMTPLVLENSPLISPLAIVLIGGLISSTLLSRLVTPVLYKLIPPKIEVTK